MQIAVKVPIGGGLRASVFARVSINARRAFLSGKVYFSKLCVLRHETLEFNTGKQNQKHALCYLHTCSQKQREHRLHKIQDILCFTMQNALFRRLDKSCENREKSARALYPKTATREEKADFDSYFNGFLETNK